MEDLIPSEPYDIFVGQDGEIRAAYKNGSTIVVRFGTPSSRWDLTQRRRALRKRQKQRLQQPQEPRRISIRLAIPLAVTVLLYSFVATVAVITNPNVVAQVLILLILGVVASAYAYMHIANQAPSRRARLQALGCILPILLGVGVSAIFLA